MPLRFPACSCAASPSRPRPRRALERQQRAWARAERATGTFAETFPVQADTVSASPTGPPPVVDPLQERRTHRLPLPGAAVHTSDWLDGRVLERDLAPACADARAGRRGRADGSATISGYHLAPSEHNSPPAPLLSAPPPQTLR